jgi:hypothetical protein
MYVEPAPGVAELSLALTCVPLADRGFLIPRRNGRRHLFEPALNLPERLRESGR